MRRQFRNCRVAILLLLLLLKVALVSCFQTIPVVVVPQTAPSFLDIRHMRCGRNASSSSSTQCRMSEDSSGIPSGTDLEKTWRYVKKPLLSIGAKGATASHGNSLKELLQDHTAVKVKVNTKAFGTLEKAFEELKDLAVTSGAPEGIEMLQSRNKDNVILFAMPGTSDRIRNGDFPPPPPPPREDEEE